MKTNLLLICSLLVFGVSGCAHRARHFTAPDSSRLTTASSKLAVKVTEATATAQRASVAVKAAKAGVQRESVAIAAIEPRIENLLRVSPMELRPEVEALKADVATLHGAHDVVSESVETAVREQGALTGQLEQANAAKNDVAKYGPEYLAAVEKQTQILNTNEEKWAKDSKALLWYRLHWWSAWIVLVLGIIGCLFLAWLKATGRLALTTASIASRL